MSCPLTLLGVQTRNCPLINTKNVVKTGSNPVKKRQSVSKVDYRKNPENECFPGFVSKNIGNKPKFSAWRTEERDGRL